MSVKTNANTKTIGRRRTRAEYRVHMGRRLYTGTLQKTLDLGRRWHGMTRRLGPLVAALWLLPACGTDPGAESARDDALTVLLPRDVQELDPRYVGDAYGIKVS